MKKGLLILAASIGFITVPVLSGCAAQVFEEEINVVFKNEGQIVANGTVTQFKNIQTPSLDSSYVPSGYKFLGWTAYSESQLDYTSATNFKTQYIGDGRMVHYSDVKKFVSGSTVVLNALMLPKEEIPKEYHYVVLAWYDKEANSKLNQTIMDTYEIQLKNYLASEGISQSDLDSIVFRGYAGNVGPTTGQILYDDDVDLMLGWGSVSNITTTGSIPESSLLESVSYQIHGGNRYLHRLTNSEGSIKVCEYLKSEASTNYFNPQE